MKGKVMLLDRKNRMKAPFSSRTFTDKLKAALGYFGNRPHRDEAKSRLKKEADMYL